MYSQKHVTKLTTKLLKEDTLQFFSFNVTYYKSVVPDIGQVNNFY